MGKRSSFERIERDFYPTPFAAVPPLLQFLRGVAHVRPFCAASRRGARRPRPRSRCASRARSKPRSDWILTVCWHFGTLPRQLEGVFAMSEGRLRVLRGADDERKAGAMVKSDLVQHIAGQNPHLYRGDIENVVNAVLGEITAALARGDRVELRGFGAFSIRHRPARAGRNPRTGANVSVDEKSVPFFKTGKEMRERLNKM